MTIAVKLASPDPAPEPGSAARAAARLGVTLTPMHPGSADPELASWYVGAVAGDEHATARALRGVPGVAAAYVKPGDAPAGSNV